MTEYYKDEVRIVEIQRKADVSDTPIGPRYKGLPRAVVDSHPELAWMLEVEQTDVVTAGSNQGEHVWVLAEAWDQWRDTQPT